MKSSLSILLIGLAAALISGCSEGDRTISGPEPTIHVREDIVVDVGAYFEISEKDYACSEYRVKVLGTFNGDLIELTGYSTENFGSSDPGWVGGSTVHTWKYLARERGNATVHLGWVSVRGRGTYKIKSLCVAIR